MGRGKDAIAVLRNAMILAKTPDEVASVQNLLDAAQQWQSAREQIEQEQQTTHGIQFAASQTQSAQAASGASKPLVAEEPASHLQANCILAPIWRG